MTTAQFRKTDFFPQTDKGSGKKVVIAVDGPAASGKGTLAAKLADRLGYAYLDTGALYRAVAFATLEMGGNPEKYDDVAPALAMVKRHLTPELLANPALRTEEVSKASSQVAALPEVRLELLDFQRDFAKNPPEGKGGAVLDGRDIGTVVCPDADVKFFVTADVKERAMRRFVQVVMTGVSFEEVLEDLKARDMRDQSRKVAPTIAADDAYTIDTTMLDAGGVLEEAIAVIRAKFVSESAA